MCQPCVCSYTYDFSSSRPVRSARLVTNQVHVANASSNNVSVITETNASALQFVAVAPCRLVDTGNANGKFGGPLLQAKSSRSFPGGLSVPLNAPLSLRVSSTRHGCRRIKERGVRF